MVKARHFMRSYLLCEEGNPSSLSSLPYDDRDIRIEVGGGLVKAKIDRVR